MQDPGPVRRRPTMEDVAARAGVSRALVSIVFRDLPGAAPENRQRVRTAAAELGYQPDQRARLLSRQRSRLIGVSFGVGHEFHAKLISELYSAARTRGYELALSGVTRDRREAVAAHDLMAFRCDALILLGPSARSAELAQLARSTPTVVVARSLRANGIDVVRTDDEVGAALATQHLIDLGHVSIVHVDGGRAPGAAERRRGYKRSMREAGLAGETAVVPGGLNDTDGSAAARQVLQDHPDATAAVVFNDQSAFGFLGTARSHGIGVPEELSITGYDNTRISRTDWAQLTTIAQQAATLAQTAVDRAIARVEGAEASGTILIEPILIRRRTSGPPPRS